MRMDKTMDGRGWVIVHDEFKNGTARLPPPTPTKMGEYEIEECEKIDSKGIPIKYRKSK